ncbi:NepR family anti-sigma factor [Stappia sp.]|uniref:NepR family anti-sigma factor n=1 Tax=Stappia sp. TaxID=1870903 RepID=UPI0032D950B9
MKVIDFCGRQRRRQGSGAAAASRIGQRLKLAYDELVEEPVPERFTELLRALDEADSVAMPETARKGHR